MSSSAAPGLRERGREQLAVRRPTGVALLLHGGRARSHQPATRANLTYQRMAPFARDLARHGRRHGLLVAQLSYRYRGWNAPDLDPVTDTRWALDRLRERHGELPVVLVGHSMGGRAALHAADDRDVLGVCALAPWTEPGEPVAQLAGKSLLIAHGDRERWTDPRLSYDYAVRAKAVTEDVCRFEVHGDGHAMLRRAREWTRLVRSFVLGRLDYEPMPGWIANAVREPSPRGLRVPLSLEGAAG
jgi:alpha-beta hydrolase superfamily lysophospholipase